VILGYGWGFLGLLNAGKPQEHPTNNAGTCTWPKKALARKFIPWALLNFDTLLIRLEMKKAAIVLAFSTLLFAACTNTPTCEPKERNKNLASIDSLGEKLNWPDSLDITGFAGPDLTPSPACLATAATGEVYVGVDMIGSLGKTPGKGKIIRLVDCNNDGILDSHTEYASVDNPRGIIAMGDKLYVLHTKFKDTSATGMDLVVFEDKDHDGIADGDPKPLVQHMSNPTYLKERGTDHATNGIRMGIDGWIYIAVGDFGFHEAEGTDGKKLTMLGGGIVRVRPDGTEMEMYTHGTRNLYDVAIDPYMNIFTRDNTNDGGGWNIRFSHHIQSGEYGYPTLFKHFTEEIIPALVDLGGGSGTGALFMDEPSWPDMYNHVPMMADWGRNELFIHRVTPSGPSFTQQQEEFIKLPQITDLDVDGSGRLYLSAWDGAGYSGDSTKGFIVRAVPKNWQYKPFPDLKNASIADLQKLLQSPSAVTRLNTQQELLSRPAGDAAQTAWKVASNRSLPLYARVAGIYTFAQAAGKDAIKRLLQLADEPTVKEFALRALTDRKPLLSDVPEGPLLNALKDPSARVRAAAIIGLGKLGRSSAAHALLQTAVPPSFVAPPKGEEGPHAKPNSDIILPHLAVHALVAINAVDSCVAAIGSDNATLALWALRYMHDSKAVRGLMEAYHKTNSKQLKDQILVTLARLYKVEAPYDGTWWWSTRPDAHGPYYKPANWQQSDTIKQFLVAQQRRAGGSGKRFFADLNGKFRLGIAGFGGEEQMVAETENKIDLNKIRNKKGQIGNTSIEDVMLALEKLKGDPSVGRKIFSQQGCVVCHTTKKSETPKGPFMGQIGSIMNREKIAESILKPNASIAQGFSTVHIITKDNRDLTGFVTEESADGLKLRDITGNVKDIKKNNIQKREELRTSIMPSGLANALSLQEFASLVAFLESQK
jgi:putative heme-binding domain-containing protein